MSKNKVILILGFLIAIMPFLGFPSAWKTFFYCLAGLILIIMAVIAHNKRQSSAGEEYSEVVTEVFVETNGTKRM